MPLRDISTIIEQDLALTAKVLQTVNSVRFAPARRMRSVFEAVQMIGFEVVVCVESCAREQKHTPIRVADGKIFLNIAVHF